MPSSTDAPATPARLRDVLQSTDAELAQLEHLWQAQNEGLMAAFGNAMQALGQAEASAQPAVMAAREHLRCAIVSLQTQDMAAQVLRQARGRLQGCVPLGAAAEAALPCAQSGFCLQRDAAGSIELFDTAPADAGDQR